MISLAFSIPLSGEDHQHLVPRPVSIGNDPGHVADALGIPDGAAAEFLYDEFHVGSPLLWNIVSDTLV